MRRKASSEARDDERGGAISADVNGTAGGYRPMTLAELAGYFRGAGQGDDRRWRLIAEFLEEYRHEPADVRRDLLKAEPSSTGDDRWDVFLAALAEHLAARDGRFWFPFNTPAARVDAIVHAPAAFRRRGVFVAPQELEVA